MFTSDLAPVPVGGTSLPALILDACQDHAVHPALVDDATGRRVTFADLGHQIDRIGAALVDRGFGRGDTIAIWAPNQPAWMAMAVGAMAAGCAVTGINPLVTDAEALGQLRATGATALATFPPFVGRPASRRSSSAVRQVVVFDADGDGVGLDQRPDTVSFSELVASTGASPDLARIADDDVILLPFSSGTTGLPKAVEVTSGALVTMLRQITAALPIGPGDATLGLPPFAHAMGGVMTGLWPLSQGAAVVTLPKFDPDRLIPAITEHHLTVVVAPPLLAGLFATHPSATPDALSSVRLLGFGSAPLPPERHRAIADRFPAIAVGQGYGLTEMTCIAAASRFEDPGPIGSVGRLVPGTELRVVDPDTGADLPAGAPGELLLRGPQLMAGYRDRPEETAATIDDDGWFRTGDLGRIDRDGYLFVIDRLKELIKCKGYQVAPAELEQVLLGHPSVADAVVVGERSPIDGDERPVAFVVPVPGTELEPDALAAWVAARVAPYKQVRAVHVIEAIPRNVNGKPLRRQLAGWQAPDAA